jgi:hypothetical protein
MVPLITAASFTAVMLTVVLPVALRAPPVPWLALLPSEKVQSICAVLGGASELLL